MSEFKTLQEYKKQSGQTKLKAIDINLLIVGCDEFGNLDSVVVYGKKEYFEAIKKYVDWRVWKVKEIKKRLP